jgi:hypothetical protein
MMVEKASGRDSPLRQGARKISWILLLLGDGSRKEAAGVEQYVLVRGE